jgi:hypothetical protein
MEISDRQTFQKTYFVKFHKLEIIYFSRYYEKSIIEQEIEELRGRRKANWTETKNSIREARYRLSLKPGNESLGNNDRFSIFPAHSPLQNGGIPKTETVSTTMYGSLPKEDLLMQPITP